MGSSRDERGAVLKPQPPTGAATSARGTDKRTTQAPLSMAVAQKGGKPPATLKDLDEKIERLVQACARLQAENKKLRAANSKLRNKNEIALDKTVAILSQLHTLEQNP